MKKTLLTLSLLALAMMAGAQDKTTEARYTRDGKTFVQSQPGRGAQPGKEDQPTAYTWRDSKGNEYPIFLHTYAKGEKAGKTTCYVIRTSAKTGKEYKYYLPDGEKIAAEITKENN